MRQGISWGPWLKLSETPLSLGARLGRTTPKPGTLWRLNPPAPPEGTAVEAVLTRALSARESCGWELIYSRQRAFYQGSSRLSWPASLPAAQEFRQGPSHCSTSSFQPAGIVREISSRRRRCSKIRGEIAVAKA